MSFNPPYGSDDASLWTPIATGSNPLSDNVKFWLDADNTGSFTTTTTDGLSTISTATDRITGIQFVGDSTYPPVYHPTASLGSDSEIGNRPTIWFSNVVNAGSQPLRNLQIGRMTSSIGAINGKLPGGNDDRSVFYVARYNGTRGFVNSYAWQYGDNEANQTYGVGLAPLGTADQEGGWAMSSGTFFLSRYASTKNFVSGSDDLTVANTDLGRLYYMFHSSSGAGSKFVNGGSDEYAYSGATLATDTGSEGSFFFGGEVESSAFRPHWALGEMIILDGVPSTDDRQRLEGYLAHKWALTGSLPADHPYKSAAPTNGGGGGGSFPNTQSLPQGNRYTVDFVDNQMSQLVTQYDRGANQEAYVPFRLSVRGPSNLRLRPSNKVYKITKD
jgi:hypothetical protein